VNLFPVAVIQCFIALENFMELAWNLNLWLYHSVEVLLCDIKLTFLNARVARTDRRIAQLEAVLASRRAR